MLHAIAKITTTSGLQGEVRLKPFSRYSIDYLMNKNLQIGKFEENLSDLKLENTVGNGKKMRFKFKGIDSSEEADSIIGKVIYINSDKDDDINLVGSNIIGFQIVTESGRKAGILKDIMWLPANDVYIVLNGDKESLIPVIDEIIIRLDLESKKIIIADIDGLLDI